MGIDAKWLKKIEEFMERAEREQFDTKDFQIAKSLAQWYEQYMAERKKPNPSRARLKQLMDDVDAKLESIDGTHDASDRPQDISVH